MSHSRAGVARDGHDLRVLRLPDGRDLSYCLYGREDGTPVLFFYGTPGTMFLAPDRLVPVDELGVRLLVVDRPGYGASTRLPGRCVAAAADDLAVLVDHLGWDRFAVWGASGGGPHALACAARLGEMADWIAESPNRDSTASGLYPLASSRRGPTATRRAGTVRRWRFPVVIAPARSTHPRHAHVPPWQ